MSSSLSRVAEIRARDSGASWGCKGAALSDTHRDRLADILSTAREYAAGEFALTRDPRMDYPTAHDVLGVVWDDVFRALQAGTSGGYPTLIQLLREIKSLDEELLNEKLRRRDTMFQQICDALAVLREVRSTQDLLGQAASGACQLGFDRSIVSRITDASWVPERVYVAQDAAWAEEILQIGREHPQPLDNSVLETQIVRKRAAILVDDVQQQARVHKAIADASLSRSYTAAPIMAHGNVVGFLHADCYYQQRSLDEMDKTVLAMFAEGLGQALARTSVLDRLSAIRSEVDVISGALTGTGGEPGWQPPRQAAPVDDVPFGGLPGHSGHQGHSGYSEVFSRSMGEDTLTRREIEVLRLMAAGDTNARIARRLVISEGTVKSHVKHILHKLGAANRAEAVSLWFRMERERPGR